MCRVPNDRSPREHADQIRELLAAPALSLDELSGDPAVCSRIGQTISRSMERPKQRRPRHLAAVQNEVRRDCRAKVRKVSDR
jgi:hypothetical protein